MAPLLALAALMIASMAIGVVANRAAQRGGFLKGFFLGNRSLGSWSMALTATVMSGGTFMGFPSLVYSYGWVLALWIGSYMMVPLCTFGVLGKRIGQISRQTGAITVPEFFRERFESPHLGLVASLLMVFILAFGLIAQFKAGATIMQLVLPDLGGIGLLGSGFGDKSPAFLYGLIIFTAVVLSYTLYGGFLAAVWTDVFQSVLMAIGVLILFPLAMMKAGGLAAGTAAGVQAVGPGFAFGPGAGREFLPLSLVFSFFCIWSIAGMGQPATLLRLMAFSSTRTLRQATGMLAVYNTLIYLPLIFIFICARAILPDLEKSDEVMPKLALTLAHPLVAGLILAAPFGAVMATISAYLVQIASAVVEDVLHRFINPSASTQTLRRATYVSMSVIALLSAGATVYSPEFLQVIIVFAGGAAACAFLVPAVMGAFWSRATAWGALASMVGGVLTVSVLYLIGILGGGDPGIDAKSKFAPIYLGGMAPFVWGMLVSVVLGLGVSLLDRPPRRGMVERFFGAGE